MVGQPARKLPNRAEVHQAPDALVTTCERVGSVSRIDSRGSSVIDCARFRFGEPFLGPQQASAHPRSNAHPLIPAMLDLLASSSKRRSKAVPVAAISSIGIWNDVVVSGQRATSQAIRAIRRVLGDDSREPRLCTNRVSGTAVGSYSLMLPKMTKASPRFSTRPRPFPVTSSPASPDPYPARFCNTSRASQPREL